MPQVKSLIIKNFKNMENLTSPYVQVGEIIERERLARQERIRKALGTDIAENAEETMEKAQMDSLNETIERGELLPEVAEFKKSIEDQRLSKADAEIYLHKIQREIAACGNFNSKKLNQLKDVTVSYIRSLAD